MVKKLMTRFHFSQVSLFRACVALLWLVVYAPSTFADPEAPAEGEALEPALRLPALFADHMVLQRDATIPVWGWAEPGATVTVSVGNRTATAEADHDGKWAVRLGRLEIGEALTLTVDASNGESIQLQDVLVGEVWLASGQSNMEMSLRGVQHAREEVSAADHPGLRLFQVPQTVSDEPRDDVQGTWSVCTPATARQFSAVAYFFGRDLLQARDVPVGIIHASVGGSPAEVWMSGQALEQVREHTDMFDKWEQGLKLWPRFVDLALYPDPTGNVYAYHQAASAARLEAGKRIRKLREEGKEIPEELTTSVRMHRQMQAWIKDRTPGGLFNGMIAPLVPFALRGVIWYQGEANTFRPDAYGVVLPALITDWRARWGQGDFPFLMVALAGYKQPPEQPGDSDWARVREAQFQTARTMANVGCASAIDLGEADDIHPKNKQDVGGRLALLARASVYGETIEAEGPVLAGWERTAEGVRVRFDHADGLHTRDGEPVRGFALAGADRAWHWADGEVTDGAVLLKSAAVPDPVAIRYAWGDNPTGNLYNDAGLPATPFRTDDWPRDD